VEQGLNAETAETAEKNKNKRKRKWIPAPSTLLRTGFAGMTKDLCELCVKMWNRAIRRPDILVS
jgi:hypothetical protein